MRYGRTMLAALLLLPLLACHTPEGPRARVPGDTGAPGRPDTGASEPAHVFTYAILADPHVVDDGAHADRLRAAVAAIGDLPEDQAPELVFILGDIAWGGGWGPAHGALDGLTVPWVPVLGDNPIQAGEETLFENTFSEHLDTVGATLPGWIRSARPVVGPEGEDLWLQNARLDWKGVRFVALDINTRTMGTLWSELPDIFDLPGGTLPFLQEALESTPEGPEDRVVLLSHMPLVPGLTLEAQDALLDVLAPHPDTVWGNHAGHLHGNGQATWDEADLQIRTTDATWDDVNAFRLVEVWSDGTRFEYRDTIVELPE